MTTWLTSVLNAAPQLQGDPSPRYCTIPPAVTSAGAEAIGLAERFGLYLDPWEQWTLTQALGERRNGKWSAFEVGIICSRQNGKTAIVEARLLAGLFLFGEELLIYTAHEFKTSQETFRRIRQLIEQSPEYYRRVDKIPESHGEEGIELTDGRRLRFLARSGTSGRGFSGDCLIYDEAMILPASDAGASIPLLSAREHATEAGPQVWYSGSAGLGKVSTQLALVRRRGIAASDAGRPDPSLMFVEWSIAPHTEYCDTGCAEHDDVNDRRSWAKSNPGLGHIHPSNGTGLTEAALEREREALDDEAFARERLGVGIYPAPIDGWAVIPRRWWKATLMTDTERPAPVVCGIDATPTQSFAAVGISGARSDGRQGVELARHNAGTKWLLAACDELDRRWGPLGWVVDPRGGAGFIIDDLEARGFNVLKPTATQIGHACAQLYAAVRDDQLRHADDTDVARALAGADKRTLGAQWAWDRTNTDVDLCPLVAITFAHWGALQLAGEQYDVGESVHFDTEEIIRLCRNGVYGPADIARLWAEDLIDEAGLTALAAAVPHVMPPMSALAQR